MTAVSLLLGIHKATVTSHDVYFYPSITSVRINEFLNSSMSTCIMRTVMISPYKNKKRSTYVLKRSAVFMCLKNEGSQSRPANKKKRRKVQIIPLKFDFIPLLFHNSNLAFCDAQNLTPRVHWHLN